MAPPDFSIDALGEILGSLSDEDMQKIIGLADSFTSQSNSDGSPPPSENGFSFDPEMLIRLMGIFEKLRSNKNDPRCNLITALKPLLSPKRRQKADQALELMKLLSILSDGDIFSL